MTDNQDDESRRLLESAGLPTPLTGDLAKLETALMSWLATRLVVEHLALAGPQGDTSAILNRVVAQVSQNLTSMDDEIRAVLYRGAPAAPNPPRTEIVHREDMARWQARRALYVQQTGKQPPADEDH